MNEPLLPIKLMSGDAVSLLIQTLARKIKFDGVRFTGRGENDINAVLAFAQRANIAQQELGKALAIVYSHPKVKELMEADEAFQAALVVPVLNARALIELRSVEAK
jgi:hypothetical protein